jgi:hypothetical protein
MLISIQVAKMCLEKETGLSRNISLQILNYFLVFMDAPVSGGVGAAAAGTLTFMVGGPAAEFEAGQSILQHMGAKIVACGEVGTGQGKFHISVLFRMNFVSCKDLQQYDVGNFHDRRLGNLQSRKTTRSRPQNLSINCQRRFRPLLGV